MSILRILSVALKELRHIKRDGLTLILIGIIPTLLLIIFGYATNQEVRAIPTLIVDQADNQMSKMLTMYLGNSKEFYLTKISTEATAMVLIPAGYGQGLNDNPRLIVDGINPVVVDVLELKLNQILLWLREDVTKSNVVKTISYPWFNPLGTNNYFMIPGVLGLILQCVTITLSSFSIVREKELGTLNRLLSTPLRGWEMMLGKLLPFFVISIFEFMVLLILASRLFQVPIRGNLTELLAVTVIFVINSLAVGMLISQVSTSQLQAMQMTIVLILPSIIMSGFVFPMNNMPSLIKWIGQLIPLTYYLQIIRGIMIKGLGWQLLNQEVMWLGGLTLSLIVLVINGMVFHATLRKLQI